MRVGIIGLLHESNTFISQPTTLEHFRQNTMLVGEPIRDKFAAAPHELGGFFQGCADAGLDAVPLFVARAMPYGTITADTFATLCEQLWRQLDATGPLDGLLVAPHGATVSERYPDADGYWLGELRRRVGPRLPICGTLDPHANLSPAMVAACDALVAYRSNPHLDQRARGVEAASLLARTLRGEIRPTMAAAFPPVAINIERQLTSEPHCLGLYAQADAQLTRPGVLSNSVILGFPYADVAEMGSAFLVATNDDRALAQSLADSLADWLWERRADFVGQMIEIPDAVERAAASAGPVCLLDMGDNVGGGSPGDSTFLAHSLHQRRLARSLVVLYDPAAVLECQAAGIGSQRTLALGGKTDALHGEPLVADFTVRGLYDGKFSEPEPRHGGFTHCDQGPSAVVECESGLTALLTSLRMPPFSLRQLTSCDLDPAAFRAIVAKGVNAPVAAYAPVCRELIRVNTPGVTTADMGRLAYRHRRRPLYPFEAEMAWNRVNRAS